MPPALTPPWNILALIHRESMLFDPRVMEALQAALGTTPEEITEAIVAYRAQNPLVAGLNGVAAVWKGTQTEYDEIPTKDPNTLYIII